MRIDYKSIIHVLVVYLGSVAFHKIHVYGGLLEFRPMGDAANTTCIEQATYSRLKAFTLVQGYTSTSRIMFHFHSSIDYSLMLAACDLLKLISQIRP